MTEATPLASEQITQEEAISALRDLLVIAGTPITERQEAVFKRARAVVAAGAAPARGTLIPVTDAKGFITLHEPDEDGKPGDLVASVWRDDWLAALSASPAPSGQEPAHIAEARSDAYRRMAQPKPIMIHGVYEPAPSDQDASQAQGEVPCPHPEIYDRGECCGQCPAPGATAQDGGREAGWTYEYDSGAGWETHTVLNTPPNLPTKRAPTKHYGSADIRNVRPFYYATPTPTIPAGMVADQAQEALEEAHALIQEAKGFAGPGDITDHLDFAESWLYKIDLTPLAAAPKQAEQQGVERDAARWRALWNSDRIRMMGCAGFDFADDGSVTLRDDGWHHMGVEVWDKHPAKGDDSDSRGRKVLLAYVDSLAALNAPTGAVEKGEAK